jgi:hypothetical protein
MERARGNPVNALLVLLHLLEGDAEGFRHFLSGSCRPSAKRHATARRRAYRQSWAVFACRKNLPVMQVLPLVLYT